MGNAHLTTRDIIAKEAQELGAELSALVIRVEDLQGHTHAGDTQPPDAQRLGVGYLLLSCRLKALAGQFYARADHYLRLSEVANG